jgi:RNA polymerase sigma factor (sigma-70 family)
MSTDQQLIDEIKDGSQSATEVLTRRYYKMVYSFIYRMTHDKELSYDLTQEVMIKMLAKLSHYHAKGEFRNWLLTVASNHCKDYFKSKSYKHKTSEYEWLDNVSSDSETVSYIFEKNEKRKVIKQALDQLPSIQKEAIVLKYFHDKKIIEIAEIMNTNDSTIKSRLKQGMDKLKKLLNRSDEVENQQQSK